MTEAKVARKARTVAKSISPVGRSASQEAKGSKPSAARNGKSKLTASPKATQKLVRDSFTIPKAEYEVLQALKERAVHLRRPAKKSELLRAGVAMLSAMTDKAFLAALNGVASLKTGRPKATNAE